MQFGSRDILFLLIPVTLGLWLAGLLAGTVVKDPEPFVPSVPEEDPFLDAIAALQSPDGVFRSTTHTLKKGSSLSTAFQEAGLAGHISDSLATLAKVKNLRRLKPGLHFAVSWADESTENPVKIALQFSETEWMNLHRTENGWRSESIQVPIVTRTTSFNGAVDVSLWDSAIKAGMDPYLISELADVFAWQIDFNREVRQGDRWRFVVEQKLAGNKHVGWGSIEVAEYVNSGESYKAVKYGLDDETGFYMPDGASLKRMFLKSPIKLARISSRFRRNRFHPILKRRIPHNGVDYAARPGTPVMAVGSGRVVKAGRAGGSGIMVKIRHNSTYQTAYLHLQGIAKGVRVGSKVSQGKVIGYVGSTGLATGPHLHFSFYENGRFVDPLGRKFPSKDPVPTNRLTEFKKYAKESIAKLPPWPNKAIVRDKIAKDVSY